MRDPNAELLAKMGEFELRPKKIIWNDHIHRFPGVGQKRGSNGWYCAQPHQRYATFGDWKAVDTQRWTMQGTEDALSPQEKEQLKRDAAKRAKDDHERSERRQEAIREAWESASDAPPIPDDHPYLKAKGIKRPRHSGRLIGDDIVIPMQWPNGKLVGLQRIQPDGRKRYDVGSRPKGAYETVAPARINPKKPVVVCEGWVTGVSIYEATGCAVAVAFSAGNLEAVAVAMRTKRPNAKVVIGADNDRWTSTHFDGKKQPNPGVLYARAAAVAANADVAIPDFKDLSDVPEGEKGPTDFNDLHQREGLDAVRKWLNPQMADKAVTETVSEPEREPEPEAEPEPGSDTKPAKPTVAKTWKGVSEALEHIGWVLRWNILNGRREWQTADGEWIADSRREVRDKIQTEIADQCQLTTGKPAHFGRDTLNLYLGRLFFDRQVDPFEEYLESLEWDEKSRIDKILEDNFGSDNDELTQFCSRYLFMTACARTIEPGAKVDEHAVFIGPYGCGKTSFAEQALPPKLRGHFRTLEMRDNKTVAESLEGCLVAEIGEGHWLTSRDRAWIKEVLTRRDDGSSIRKAYATTTEQQLRRAAIVITGDHDHVLPNDPNLRRFVVARFKHGCSIEDMYAGNRDQYWAEAWHRVKKGESACLPRHLIPKSAERSETHRSRVMGLDERVAKILSTIEESSGHIRSGELLAKVRGEDHDGRSTQWGKYLDHEIWSEVRAAGWVPAQRRFTAGKPQYRAWVPQHLES